MLDLKDPTLFRQAALIGTDWIEPSLVGMKQSRLRREGLRYGLDEFMKMKYTCFGGIGTIKQG